MSKVPSAKAAKAADGAKKDSKLGLTAKKETDFADWYSQVVVEGELISYYDVSGCYILRPSACAMWDVIREFFDGEIKKLGVQNAYFPLFITEAALNTEKDHLEGFAPEVAWVTKGGRKELDRPVAIRPTSETVIYPYFAQWIRSHRDLPLRLNQWTNVVRWEFKDPTPFIRSREFLWQEGHTAFATKEEADAEVLAILDLYARIYEELLAVPVTKGRKTEAEKFAGALYTTTVEAYVPAWERGIQGGTSHCLGQNFSRMFKIEYEAEKGGEKAMPWQNSWGFTTRSIGVSVMTHGDDKGLVLPPRVASIQAVIIPILNASMDADARAAMLRQTQEIEDALRAAGVRARSDTRDNYRPGWKYNYWELRGVPLRVELGPKDMVAGTVLVVRRDTGAKEGVQWAEIGARAPQLLEAIQSDLLAAARAKYDAAREKATTWADFMAAIKRKNMVLAPWCDEKAVEDELGSRAEAEGVKGVKSLCTPFEQPDLPEGTLCFLSGKPAKNWTLWGKSC
ncbi:hypothetical protein H632_c116p0 [Helicosporidium sp. ATCC 50920]|nr:hypothetical protein H632_c116p0 [Helicosporidium sp. ATCC 50920]|eukprot:KDD76757.1 hypothetical protein H632_c116p0 [Helicosporidium sp. ATCC 50920]